MSKNKNETTISFRATELLLVAFIILKLCHIIDWSWCWVTAPLWIPITIAIILTMIKSFTEDL